MNDSLPSGTIYFINEDKMIWRKPVFHFNLIDKILHFFGKHIYVWHKKKCIYPKCKQKC